MFCGNESRGCLSSRFDSIFRSRGGLGSLIGAGDCCLGRSKNEGAFSEGPPSRSILSGASCLGCGLDFGDVLSWVSDLVGRRSGFGRRRALGVDAKCERFPCPRLKALGPSVCLLNAAKSGFASSGRCFGDAAPNERIEDEGGLQLSFGPAPESRGSVAGSTMRPK